MKATKRQSRSRLMSEPRVHWANGAPAGRLLGRGRPAPEDVTGVHPEQQREQQDHDAGPAADRDAAAAATTAATAHL